MKLTFKGTAIACYFGSISQAIVNNLAPILFVIFKREFGITDEQLGRLILMNFGTQIVADILATRYADRIGHRVSVVAAHMFCAAGLMLMGILPFALPSAYAGLCVAAVIYALGGGIIEVMISPIVESLPSEHKEKAMSMAHSFYCWGQLMVVLISTALLWALSDGIWRFLPLCWAAVPFVNGLAFARAPLMPAAPEERRTRVRELLRSKAFLLAIVMMICSGSAELTMSQWSSLFAEQALGVSKILGDLLGPCLFALCMAITRMLYGMYGERIRLNRALSLSAALCVACYLLAVFAPIPAFSLVGCALCGASVALMWPGTLSSSAKRFPAGGTALFGVLAVSGDIGCSFGPWLSGLTSDIVTGTAFGARLMDAFGWTAQQVGLKAGLCLGAIFPLLMLFCARQVSRDK